MACQPRHFFLLFNLVNPISSEAIDEDGSPCPGIYICCFIWSIGWSSSKQAGRSLYVMKAISCHIDVYFTELQFHGRQEDEGAVERLRSLFDVFIDAVYQLGCTLPDNLISWASPSSMMDFTKGCKLIVLRWNLYKKCWEQSVFYWYTYSTNRSYWVHDYFQRTCDRKGMEWRFDTGCRYYAA